MAGPKVSVVIPCYNQAAFLRECLDSVFAQTYRDFEVIVVDDGSTEPESVRILDAFDDPRVRLIRKRNEGVSIARNEAIAAARGEYVLPIDADDRIAPGFLSFAAGVLDARPEVGIVGGRTERFGAESGPWDRSGYSFPLVLMANMLVNTCCFRRADWETVGGYNPNMRYGWEDWDFWLSLIGLGRRIVLSSETLHYYRAHGVSRNASLLRSAEWVQAMKLQLVENHRALYDAHPRQRDFLLLGRRTWRHALARVAVKCVKWALPVRAGEILKMWCWKVV